MKIGKLWGRFWLEIWECAKLQQIWCHRFFLVMRNRGSLMSVLRVLVSWLKETTFSVVLSHIWIMALPLSNISNTETNIGSCHGPKWKQWWIVFCHHKGTVHFKILKKKSNCELVLLLGNTGNYMWGSSSGKTQTLAWCLDLASR